MRWIAIVVFVVACGDVPDSDLDGDGLADAVDDCQAGFSDDAVDADGDGKDATVDLCPHDKNATAGDIDEDGIPDACDPFIAPATPDTRRCVTSFRVRWMNASYLVNRAGEQAWDLTPPLTAKSTETVSVVSTFELDYRSTSFDVVGTATFAHPDATSSFRLWLRAVESPSDKDIACGIDGSNNLYVWAGNTRQVTRPLPAPLAGPFRLRATVQATPGGGNTVLCRATVGTESIATTLPAELAPGLFGFAAQATDVTIESVVVDTNDAAVPF